MEFWRTAALLLLLVTGTLSQGFDLLDAFDDVPTTPAKSKEVPKNPQKPKSDNDGGLDLLDAFGPDPTTKPSHGGDGKAGGGKSGGLDGFDLGDALGPGGPTEKTPHAGGGAGGGGGGKGGRVFDDSDLIGAGDGKYNPGGGHSGRGGAEDYNPHGGEGEPQEAGSGKIAGIVSAIGVALLGAASSYIAYQKKKLCFKIQGGADPERGKVQYGQQSDPQVFSNLLRTS